MLELNNIAVVIKAFRGINATHNAGSLNDQRLLVLVGLNLIGTNFRKFVRLINLGIKGSKMRNQSLLQSGH